MLFLRKQNRLFNENVPRMSIKVNMLKKRAAEEKLKSLKAAYPG